MSTTAATDWDVTRALTEWIMYNTRRYSDAQAQIRRAKVTLGPDVTIRLMGRAIQVNGTIVRRLVVTPDMKVGFRVAGIAKDGTKPWLMLVPGIDLKPVQEITLPLLAQWVRDLVFTGARPTHNFPDWLCERFLSRVDWLRATRELLDPPDELVRSVLERSIAEQDKLDVRRAAAQTAGPPIPAHVH